MSLTWAALPFAALAQPRAQLPEAGLTASMEAGFARLIFTFPGEAKADVQLSNNVLVVRFAKPSQVSVAPVQTALKELVQAARADPDGTAVRIAFAHKVSVNTMAAGEKLFVDILPESWTGLPPGLPQEVVDELSRRARDAERKSRLEQVQTRQWQPVKLRFAQAPGFARFAFATSEPIPVRAEQDGQELRITFAAPVKVDLGEARLALPPSVVALDTEYTDTNAVVRVVLAPQASARHFREDSAFVVDVTPPPPAKPERIQGEVPPPQTAAEVKATPPDIITPEQQTSSPATPAKSLINDKQPLQAASISPEVEVRADVAVGPTGVRISFAFGEAVPAAVFRRGDRIWMVFDTKRAINVHDLIEDRTRSFSDVSVMETQHGKAVRLRLKGGWLTSVEANGHSWVVHFGDAVVAASRPLNVQRLSEESGAVLAVPLESALSGKLHQIDDAEIGDEIRVVTAHAPVRGVLRAQDFLEFQILPSAHGLALLPLADDVSVVLQNEAILVGRPKGLALSTAQRTPTTRPQRTQSSPLDVVVWEAERNRRFSEREAELLSAAAATPAERRAPLRISLARFYLAHGLATEAKGTLTLTVQEDEKAATAGFHLLRGLSELMIGRPAKALEDFSNSELANSQDAALLRAIAHAELGAWTETREYFRAGSAGLKLLPVDLQRRVLFAALRAAVEVRDFSEAGRLMNELEGAEVPPEMAAQFVLLAGRIAEGLGRTDRAEEFYRKAIKSDEGPAAAEARSRQAELKMQRGDMNRAKTIEQLESLAFTWRGDRVEVEANRLLARLYVDEARYRDAFRLLDAALLAQPNATTTRTLHNEMAVVFEDLFLSGKADALPPVEMLALYYDFSKLTPIGRRGDELIRRLSERLVAVDLLDQASELLEHQVQFRLTGVPKSQVATRLAIVHLMNRKPQKAIAVLAATRLADLPREIREQRLLLEARALMSMNRFDQAVDILASIEGPEADRLRADIFWQAKRWRQAGEAVEGLLGERWKDTEALSELERHDVLRAGLAYALAGETLGLTRLKEKYANKLNGAPEKAAFDLIAENPNPNAIGAATKALSHIDSLAVFLKMYQARYPTAQMPAPPEQLSAR